MLGTLLEFATWVRSVSDVLNFHERLGFQSLPVGDIVQEPYAVVSAGGIAIGLHGGEPATVTPIFVRPDLSSYSRAFRRAGIAFESSHLASDEFHRLAFRDPSGLLVTLIEARTFSAAPAPEDPSSACGEFLELSVAVHSLQESRRFWAALGLAHAAQGDAPHPWARLSGHGLTLGLHEAAPFAPGLTFRAAQLEARAEYLRVKGFEVRPGAPFARARDSGATLIAPDGAPFYLLERAGA